MNRTITSRIVPTWVRLALVALAVPSILTGLWAVVSPQGWFEDFPGFDPRLVAAEPPFNEHLASDAGAGLLASGLVLLVAAVLADSRSVRLGLIANAAFALPHSLWHTFNPSEPLTDGQNIQNAGLLLFNAAAAIALYVAVSRHDRAPSPDSTPSVREQVSA
ncbi:hypothetical protein [Actinospongicola halichondriae]|uniref:hypothetical protein n=1 Tax=Actinospongicola halichondriae TaxID=3236844 RepID=UPI003D4CB444